MKHLGKHIDKEFDNDVAYQQRWKMYRKLHEDNYESWIVMKGPADRQEGYCRECGVGPFRWKQSTILHLQELSRSIVQLGGVGGMSEYERNQPFSRNLYMYSRYMKWVKAPFKCMMCNVVYCDSFGEGTPTLVHFRQHHPELINIFVLGADGDIYNQELDAEDMVK